MGIRTGRPRGRPKGAKNKRTIERAAHVKKIAKAAAKALGVDTFEGDAHALLMLTYKDKTLPIDVRLDAAKAAAPYEKPKLSAVEFNGELDVQVEEVRRTIVDPRPKA